MTSALPLLEELREFDDEALPHKYLQEDDHPEETSACDYEYREPTTTCTCTAAEQALEDYQRSGIQPTFNY